MPGPAPKPPGQRRNRRAVAGATTLVPVAPDVASAALPERDDGKAWHPAARELWDAVMRSPMSGEYDESDLVGLLRLVDLTHAYWAVRWDDRGGARTKVLLAAEIRLEQQNFGLSPLDRWRLKWEIDRGGAAEDNTARRRQAARGSRRDPREAAE